MQANVFPEYTFEAILDDEGDHIKDLELKLKTQGKGVMIYRNVLVFN